MSSGDQSKGIGRPPQPSAAEGIHANEEASPPGRVVAPPAGPGATANGETDSEGSHAVEIWRGNAARGEDHRAELIWVDSWPALTWPYKLVVDDAPAGTRDVEVWRVAAPPVEVRQVGAGQLGAGQLGAGQLGAGQVGAGQLGAGQLGAGRNGTGGMDAGRAAAGVVEVRRVATVAVDAPRVRPAPVEAEVAWTQRPWEPPRRRLQVWRALELTAWGACLGVVLAVAVQLATADRLPILQRRPAAEQSPCDSAVCEPPAAPISGQPTRVRIQAIDVDSQLEVLGLDAAGALQPPKAYERAGWFREGVVPGDTGPAVVAGHVDSRRGRAVFYELHKLRPGDIVQVQRGNRWVAFRVTRTEQYPKNKFPTDRVYGPTPDAELRLITCGGSFDRSRLSYRDNIVVYAVIDRSKPSSSVPSPTPTSPSPASSPPGGLPRSF